MSLKIAEKLLSEDRVDELVGFFSASFLEEILAQVADPLRVKYYDYINKDSRRLHNPENPYYDLSLIDSGMKVYNRMTKASGIVTKGSDGILELVYDDGTIGYVYPNQIEKCH